MIWHLIQAFPWPAILKQRFSERFRRSAICVQTAAAGGTMPAGAVLLHAVHWKKQRDKCGSMRMDSSFRPPVSWRMNLMRKASSEPNSCTKEISLHWRGSAGSWSPAVFPFLQVAAQSVPDVRTRTGHAVFRTDSLPPWKPSDFSSAKSVKRQDYSTTTGHEPLPFLHVYYLTGIIITTNRRIPNDDTKRTDA